MARNLQALLPLVREYGPGRIAFCTDDRDPEDIVDRGHVNGMVRDAVAAGIAPADAIVMASWHPALWHGLDRLGAVAPGYLADLLVLPDLERFVPDVVLKRGRPLEDVPRSEIPAWVRQTVRLRPVTATSFAIPVGGRRGAGDRARQRAGRHGVARPRAARRRRARGLRPGTRPRQARRRRAAPRDRADRARLPLRLRPRAWGARVERRARRAQPRRRRGERRRHGVRRAAPRADGRRDRGRRRRRGRRGMPVARRRAPLRPAARRRRRAEPRLQRGGLGAGLERRHAVPDARVPRALGDPLAEAHRPRPRRRRSLRARPARRRRA